MGALNECGLVRDCNEFLTEKVQKKKAQFKRMVKGVVFYCERNVERSAD